MKLLNATIFATIIASTQADCTYYWGVQGRTPYQVSKNLNIPYDIAKDLYGSCRSVRMYVDYENCISYGTCRVENGYLYLNEACDTDMGPCRPNGRTTGCNGGPCGAVG